MKAVAAVGLVLALGASGAGAADIKGKWGIGAGLFTSGGEASVIRGHSDRTAWVFDVSLGGSVNDVHTEYTTPPIEFSANANDWRVGMGPRFRRFTRPGSEFSPYWDLFARTTFGRSHFSGPRNRTSLGLGTGLAFGLEYFTRWHCSVAAHTTAFNLNWDRTRLREGIEPYIRTSTDGRFSASIAISPALYVRAYF